MHRRTYALAFFALSAILFACGSSDDTPTVGVGGTAAGTGGVAGAGAGGTAGSGGTATGGSAGAIAGGSAGTSTGGSAGAAGTAAGGAAGEAGSGTGGAGGSAGSTTTIRVHYPAGSHTVSLRGGSAPLSWTSGVAFTAGANDTWTWTTTGLQDEIECKPLLDDATWARGPNYHVKAGATVDLYPHFTELHGQYVQLFSAFHSTALNNDRIVWAYYPAVYVENPLARLPVLYMHDGQNLFHGQSTLSGYSWEVDTAFNDAGEHGWCKGSATSCNGDGDCGAGGRCETLPEVIVIGPEATTGRCYEYTPTIDQAEIGSCDGGGGDLYLQLLINELKPQVDTQLRTQTAREATAVMGSSLGGLISAYAGVGHADVYGLVGAVSPSTWWDNQMILGKVATMASQTFQPLKVYVDVGTSNDGEADTKLLADAYEALGYVEGVDFHYVVQTGASHSEQFWQQRFPGAVMFLFGPRQ